MATIDIERLIEKELIREAQNKNKKCLETLIKKYDYYLINEVSKYKGLKKEEYEEGYNCAVLGLINAIYAFDTSIDVKLFTFASSYIKRELTVFIKFIMSINKRVIYPKNYKKDKMLELDNYEDIFETENKSSREIENVERKVYIEEITQSLNSNQKEILRMTYYEDKSIDEISLKLKTTSSSIKSKKRKIFESIRKEAFQCY